LSEGMDLRISIIYESKYGFIQQNAID